jgi:hypothetical protein
MELILKSGAVVLFDEEDSDIVARHNWYALEYVLSTTTPRVRLHRLIMGAKRGELVDHINGDTLDNRRSNLRFATKAENSRNARIKGGSSRFKGVSFNGWAAHIRVDGKLKHLGRFATEEEAARAYNEAAIRHFGEFARLNEL